MYVNNGKYTSPMDGMGQTQQKPQHHPTLPWWGLAPWSFPLVCPYRSHFAFLKNTYPQGWTKKTHPPKRNLKNISKHPGVQVDHSINSLLEKTIILVGIMFLMVFDFQGLKK